MATKKNSQPTTKPASKKQTGLQAMLRALETEIEKQKEAIEGRQGSGLWPNADDPSGCPSW